jgi:Tfp pilus assembly protein PilO
MDQLVKLIQKINEKNPYYTIIAGIIVLLVIDYFVLLQFQFSSLRALNPRLTTLSQDLRNTRNNLKQMDKFQNEIKQLTVQSQDLNSKIKSKEEIPLILDSINRLANKNGVVIEQIVPNTMTEDVIMKNNDGQYLAVPVKVEAYGAYHNFGRFLNQLENEEKFFTISDFNIIENAQDPVHHSINLTLRVLIFEQERS